MADRIDITSLTIDDEPREAEKAVLVLNDVGTSWGLEIRSNDPVFMGYFGGNAHRVTMTTADGEFTGAVKVLRSLGAGPWDVEMFANGDLMKIEDENEEVFRAQFL